MTVTWVLRSDLQADGAHVAEDEVQLTLTEGVDATLSATIAGSSNELCSAWTTTTDVGYAQWGTGTYTITFSLNTIGAGITFGCLTVGASAGHLARVDTGLTADIETILQNEAAFSGTGVKTATFTWTPGAGATTDRAEILVAAANSDTMSQSIQYKVNLLANSTLSGPFDGAGVVARTPQRTTTGVGT